MTHLKFKWSLYLKLCGSSKCSKRCGFTHTLHSNQTLTRSCGLKVFPFLKIDLMKIRKIICFTHKLIKSFQFTNWNSSEWARKHDFDDTGVNKTDMSHPAQNSHPVNHVSEWPQLLQWHSVDHLCTLELYMVQQSLYIFGHYMFFVVLALLCSTICNKFFKNTL